MSIQKELSQIIKDNLPEQTAKEMREVLDEYERLKRQTSDDHNTIKRLVEEKLEFSEKCADQSIKLAHQIEKVKAFQKREDEIKIKENQLEHDRMAFDCGVLHAELKASEKFGERVTEFMIGMSRNTVYKRSFAGNEHFTVPGVNGDQYNQGQQGYVDTRVIDKTETVKEE